MGNVDNRANIGNQTIINIQNMPGNIVLPDSKVKSGNTPSGVPGVQNDSVYYDEEFDGRVLMLDRALRRLSETIEKGDKNRVKQLFAGLSIILMKLFLKVSDLSI